jgi:hypothetical protein
MKFREARGAVGCGPIRSHLTTRVGVTSTIDTAENTDSVTIRRPPRGCAASASRTRGSGQATAAGVPGQSRTCRHAVASTSTSTGSAQSSTADRSQTAPRDSSAKAKWIARSRSSMTSPSRPATSRTTTSRSACVLVRTCGPEAGRTADGAGAAVGTRSGSGCGGGGSGEEVVGRAYGFNGSYRSTMTVNAQPSRNGLGCAS